MDAIRSDTELEVIVRNLFGKIEEYTIRGSKLVKDDRIEEWDRYVGKFVQDPYSAKIIETSLYVMERLSEGKKPENIITEIGEADITLAQAGYVADIVSYFHPRGEEFKDALKRYLKE